MIKIVLSPGQEDVSIEIVATEDKVSSAVDMWEKYIEMRQTVKMPDIPYEPDKTIKPLEPDTVTEGCRLPNKPKPNIKKQKDGWVVASVQLPGDKFVEFSVRANGGEIEILDIDYISIEEPK